MSVENWCNDSDKEKWKRSEGNQSLCHKVHGKSRTELPEIDTGPAR
jgi:hypothetical protein